MTKFRKLGRPTGHRMSMLRTMVSQLVKHERIETTVAKLVVTYARCETSEHCRNGQGSGPHHNLHEIVNGVIEEFQLNQFLSLKQAKEIRRLADNMVQLGKEGSLCAARRAAAFVRGDDVIHKLFTELAYRYKDRAGGYTRLLRTRIRVGDAAPMAYIEFIDRENELRQSKPATPQPPQRVPLDPWTRSRLCKQFAPPKEDKSSDPEI
uniref:50S ribosomal protein L17 n=1 Tax=Vitis vinifera TaxID=29760 RepID=A5B5J2_VITVI|nr:hypothetical protein VITISV_026602 [Vitis vinifera]